MSDPSWSTWVVDVSRRVYVRAPDRNAATHVGELMADERYGTVTHGSRAIHSSKVPNDVVIHHYEAPD